MERDWKRGLWRRVGPALLGVSGFLCAASGNASQSAKLVYARTADSASCGDEATLRQAVARRLGYDPFVAVSENTLVAEMRGDPGGLSARVFMIERGNLVTETREFSSKSRDCEELRLAVALAISIAIDPDAIERVPEPDSPADSALAPTTALQPNSENEAAPATAQVRAPLTRSPQITLSGAVRSDATWRFGAGGFIGTGPLPFPSGGVTASASADFRLWSLGIEAKWFIPRDTDAQSTTGDRARANLVGLAVVPCYRAHAFRGCYLLELGRLGSRGLVSQPHQDASLWVAQGLRLSYHFGGEYGWGATVNLDGLVAMNRVNLYLNSQPLWHSPWLVGRLGIELNYAF